MNATLRNILTCSLIVAGVPLLAGCPEEKPTVAVADAAVKPVEVKTDAGAKTVQTTAGDAGTQAASDGGTAQTITHDAGATEAVVKVDEMKKIKPKNPASHAGTAWADGSTPAADGVVAFSLKKGTQSLVDARIEDCRSAAEKSEPLCAKPAPTPATVKDAAKSAYAQRVGNLLIKLTAAKDDKGKALASADELEKIAKESFDVEALAKL